MALTFILLPISGHEHKRPSGKSLQIQPLHVPYPFTNSISGRWRRAPRIVSFTDSTIPSKTHQKHQLITRTASTTTPAVSSTFLQRPASSAASQKAAFAPHAPLSAAKQPKCQVYTKRATSMPAAVPLALSATGSRCCRIRRA